ncbi:hypothetical protein PQX77_006192 [Marasmius sp. AFHP31]|nr:hypothetical protein PQX77_006192 [Marasmius sp. AFHP31]
MANRVTTKPQAIEARLRTMVLALHASVNDHPLVELGDKAYTFIINLIAKDPAHKVDEKAYRGFYKYVSFRDIMKRLESTQAEGNLSPAQSRLFRLDKYRLGRLEKSSTHGFIQTHVPPACKWEDVLILTGSIVSTISAAPGLDLLKCVGGILSQIGELVKTTRGNKAEYTELFRLAAGILHELTTKIQTSHVKPTDDKRCVGDLERTLIRIRDSISEIERESRTERLGRLLFAAKTKEELSCLRRELGDAHNRFMASIFSPP